MEIQEIYVEKTRRAVRESNRPSQGSSTGSTEMKHTKKIYLHRRAKPKTYESLSVDMSTQQSKEPIPHTSSREVSAAPELKGVVNQNESPCNIHVPSNPWKHRWINIF